MSTQQPNAIRQDYLNGMTYAAIARKYMIDARTAKRYVQLDLPLATLEKRPFASVLDPYKKYIDAWIKDDPVYATTIHDRLVELGCQCGYTIVNDYVRSKTVDTHKPSVPSKSANKQISLTKKINDEKDYRNRRRM